MDGLRDLQVVELPLDVAIVGRRRSGLIDLFLTDDHRHILDGDAFVATVCIDGLWLNVEL